ncbi:ABC-2 type transport system permease protein [Anaerocolumna jejuensis DSM 15929]|uniref:ABC-2 type transport system permease protein n=1 Tax=Anaerocolumna jejuensis DSM 15929 TaxID=1121322 RepID=A0A1M7DTN9_9FIRM|nr:ABC transporter permease [Anaerocolumna jejuensis]SHL82738.1 ABC-2 type transport system permease protein [Anaerocolumna jejuensis DSM 15929]
MMLRMIKTEFEKLKRLHILLIGLIGMAFPAILSIFTQAVVTEEGKVENFDFSALFNSSIWNNVTIFMPVIFTLIGGYLINREYTDNTLKNILPVPVSFQRLLFGKLLAMGTLSVLFGFYSYTVTLIVGLFSGIPGLNAGVLFTGLLQMLGISLFTYIAVLPIIAVSSRKPGIFMGGVIAAFLFGYSAMFIKNVTMRSLYPILSGLTVMGFDTGTFMNTTEPGNLTLSIAALTVMLVLTAVLVMLAYPSQAASKSKKHKTAGMFLRPGQKGR